MSTSMAIAYRSLSDCTSLSEAQRQALKAFIRKFRQFRVSRLGTGLAVGSDRSPATTLHIEMMQIGPKMNNGLNVDLKIARTPDSTGRLWLQICFYDYKADYYPARTDNTVRTQRVMGFYLLDNVGTISVYSDEFFSNSLFYADQALERIEKYVANRRKPQE